MRCPVDGTTLGLTERHGVEIDYCPQCRGLWLDRGELDRIIDHAAGDGSDYNDRGHRHEEEYGRRHRDDDHDHRSHDGHDRRHHDDGHEYRRHGYDDEYGEGHRQSGRKRGSAFTALSDLLGGGGDD